MFINKAIRGCEDIIKNMSHNLASAKANVISNRAIEILPILHKAHTIHIAKPIELVESIVINAKEELFTLASNKPGLPFPVVWIDFPPEERICGGDVGGVLVEELSVNEDKSTNEMCITTFYTQTHRRLPGVSKNAFIFDIMSSSVFTLRTGEANVKINHSLNSGSGGYNPSAIEEDVAHTLKLITWLIASLIIALYSKRIVLVDKKKRVKTNNKKKVKGLKSTGYGQIEYKILSIKLNDEQKRYIGTSEDTTPFGTVGVHWRMKRERTYQADTDGKGGLFGGPWSGTLRDECVYVNKGQHPAKKFVFQDRHVKT